MIVRSTEPGLRVFTQNDHAHFSGELITLWRAPEVAEHPRRKALIFAAREHDNGWREADSAPRHDPATGGAHTFLTIPGELRREIWDRGVRRFAAERPYASLLILAHALHLHRRHAEDPAWAATFEKWRALSDDLLAASGASPEEVREDYPWIDLADHLSLACCRGWTGAAEHRGFRYTLDGPELRLDPFPLAGATTFRIPCRAIPERAYGSDSDLAIELASARWEELRIRVAPLGAD